MKKEILRKIFHIFSILSLIIPVEIFGKYSITVLMFLMLAIFLPISYFRIKNPLTAPFWKILEYVERDFNWKTLPGRQAYALGAGLLAVSILFNTETLEIAIITTAIYDGIATIVGKLYGKHKISGLNKSYEGTISGIIVNSLSLMIFLNPVKAILISIAAAIIELSADSKKWYLDDNFIIPLGISAFYTALKLFF